MSRQSRFSRQTAKQGVNERHHLNCSSLDLSEESSMQLSTLSMVEIDDGRKNGGEWFGWKVRLNKPAEFEVSAKYTTGSTANRGSYAVMIGDQVLKATVEPTPSENQSATTTLGRIKLNRGEYEIMIKPTDIQ